MLYVSCQSLYVRLTVSEGQAEASIYAVFTPVSSGLGQLLYGTEVG